MQVTFRYTRRSGQRPDRYPNETETVAILPEEIAAMKDGETTQQKAIYVAFEKRLTRADGRKAEIIFEM